MRNRTVAANVVALVLLGCGDNSKECGPGTIDDRGTCVPAAMCGFGTVRDDETGECVPDGSVVCSEGTVFDPLTGRCQIDPASCRDGTVLIGNACVDPTKGLVVDVQEGPEPNGLGILEASDAQAGNITLKPAGSTFVVHGTLDPHRDADGDGALDPDVDTYVLTVAGPVLLSITADGVHGINAGFIAVAAVAPSDPLATWRRFGVNLVGDTSRRQVYLPRAGTYHLAIADTRTLSEYLHDGAATAAPGGPDGDYYISITDLGAPQPAPVTVDNGMATVASTTTSDALKFYTVPMGTGLNTVTLAMPSELARASIVVVNNGELRAHADEDANPARVIVGEIQSGDTTLVVVDNAYNLSPSPVGFTLTVETSDAP